MKETLPQTTTATEEQPTAMKPAAGKNSAARAVQLQRKIFTRWVNQKVMKRGLTVDDVVAAIGDGIALIALMEGMSHYNTARQHILAYITSFYS